MLAGEGTWCVLVADLANPTTAHIYQSIGFEPAGDVDEYALSN